jgi:hypothetical protein
LGKIFGDLGMEKDGYILWPLEYTYYGHLVHFMGIWWQFGVFPPVLVKCQEKSGNPGRQACYGDDKQTTWRKQRNRPMCAGSELPTSIATPSESALQLNCQFVIRFPHTTPCSTFETLGENGIWKSKKTLFTF